MKYSDKIAKVCAIAAASGSLLAVLVSFQNCSQFEVSGDLVSANLSSDNSNPTTPDGTITGEPATGVVSTPTGNTPQTGPTPAPTSLFTCGDVAMLKTSLYDYGANWAMNWISDIALDSIGNKFFVGSPDGMLDGLAPISVGHNEYNLSGDGFLTKFDSSNVRKWTVRIGATKGNFHISGAAPDQQGGLVISGSLINDTTTPFFNQPMLGTKDAFVAHYDATGKFVWATRFGAAGATVQASKVVLDSDGYAYVVGTSTAGLDGNALVGKQDVFISKLDPNGGKVWTRELGVTLWSYSVAAIQLDSTKQPVILGQKKDLHTEAGNPYAILDSSLYPYIAKFDNAGNLLFNQLVSQAHVAVYPSALVLDAQNQIYAVGSTGTALNGGAQVGSKDLFVMKRAADGSAIWTKQTGVAGKNVNGNDVAFDSAGNLIVVGSTDG